MVERGEITITVMFRSIMGLLMAGMGISQSSIFFTDTNKAKAAAKNVFHIIDRVPEIDVRCEKGNNLSADMQGSLTLEKINFQYPQRKDVQVYRDVTFDIKAGETVALVGASGCGKSTVVALLERFYDVNRTRDWETNRDTKTFGGISLDGVDIRDLNLRDLRANLGLVSQEPTLFGTSIAENIRYGKDDATMDEIMAAAKNANAHNFIMEFPDGYDTDVGKMGGKLSGGQKQRVAIARALIRNPKVLLLDEATSALDAESEKIVQEALDKAISIAKRTTIIIAHRLSTIQQADKIVVFSNEDNKGSRIVEVGKHADLMQNVGGVYWGLVRVAQSTEGM